jgi:hypothetical protein
MTSNSMTSKRVSSVNPCPVCEKPDWCLLLLDGSGMVWGAICARNAEGGIKRCGEAGWLHRLRDSDDWHHPRTRRVTVPMETGPSRKDLGDLAVRFRAAVDPGALDRHARALGLSAVSLCRLGVGWCEESRAWSFPMVDAAGRVRGLRLRTPVGRKFAVKAIGRTYFT